MDAELELLLVIKDLDRCIEEVKRRAVDDFEGLDPFRLMDANGTPLLAPLIIAKANALAALVAVRKA